MSGRPLGIVLVVVYAAINAFLSIVAALLALLGGAFVGAAARDPQAEAWLGFLSLLAILLGAAPVTHARIDRTAFLARAGAWPDDG